MTKLIERTGGGRVSVPEGSGAEIEIRLMGWPKGATMVEGSSADYPVDVIARDFPESFPAGTRMRANHDGLCEAGGDVRRIMAKTTSAPVQREDGMYAKARVKEGEATDFVRQFADVVGLSISAGAELAKEQATDPETGEPMVDFDNEPIMKTKMSERGMPIVERFLTMDESPYNAVDFVEAPGADGRIVGLAIEAAKQIVEHTTIREGATFAVDLAGKREKASEATPPGINKKENEMEKEERDSLRDEIVQSVTEALKPARPQATEHSLSDTVEAVLEAGLSKRGRTRVLKQIEAGEDAAGAIAEQKSLEDGIREEFGATSTPAPKESETLTGYTVGEGHGFPQRESTALSEDERKTLAALESSGEVL